MSYRKLSIWHLNLLFASPVLQLSAICPCVFDGQKEILLKDSE